MNTKSKKTILSRLLGGDVIRRYEVSGLLEFKNLIKANKIKSLNSAGNELTETTHSKGVPPSHNENDIIVTVAPLDSSTENVLYLKLILLEYVEKRRPSTFVRIFDKIKNEDLSFEIDDQKKQDLIKLYSQNDFIKEFEVKKFIESEPIKPESEIGEVVAFNHCVKERGKNEIEAIKIILKHYNLI